MGGAIAARVCDRIGALGLILVDIVEGTARASYPHIRAIIENRPSSFVSAASAISWRCAPAAILRALITSARELAPGLRDVLVSLSLTCV